MKALALSVFCVLMCSAATQFASAEDKKDIDWDKQYEALLEKSPEVRNKVESGGATKEDVIAWMKRGGMKKNPSYKEAKVDVKDPTLFGAADKERLFSGPQAGEKLPALKVVGFASDQEGESFDPVDDANGRPLVLIFSDQSPVSVKGLYFLGPALQRIKEQSKSDLSVSVIYLGDDRTELEADDVGYLQKRTNIFTMARSSDGRDGPGAYGLNRNVAMTIIVARDGKVLHNFAFAQPMLYPDGHVLGGVADALQTDRKTLAGWLSGGYEKGKATMKMMSSQDAAKKKATEDKGTSFDKKAAAEKKAASARKAALAEKKVAGKDADSKNTGEDKDAANAEAMKRKAATARDRARNRNFSEVKDPAGFAKLQAKEIFSGPQPDEKLPAVKVAISGGDREGETFDPVAKAAGKPLILSFQDGSGVGLRGLIAFSKRLDTIAANTKVPFQHVAVLLGDDPEELSTMARRISNYVPDSSTLTISKDGRAGPGAYGLDRTVGLTVLIAKDGVVKNNFALPQGMLSPDAHILGAVADLIKQDYVTVAGWLNDAAEEAMMRRDAASRERGARPQGRDGQRGAGATRQDELRTKLGQMVREGTISRAEAAELFQIAFPIEASPERGR